MKRLVFIGFLVGMLLWLTGCGGTYKHIEVEYPTSPYTKYKELKLEVISPAKVNKEEVKSFRELIISALQKRGIIIVADNKEFVLIVEIQKFHKGSRAARTIGTALLWIIMIPTPPLDLYTSNAIELKVSIKDKEGILEFKEFQEFKEKIKDWEDLKKTVANRIADAVYFAR